MKISKLFHWLYAVLMLLPVLFIGTRCLYTIFNKNAKDSYSGDTTYEINYKYQSNEVNSVNDLVVGNIYEFNFDNNTLDNYFSNSVSMDLLCLKNETFNLQNYDLTEYIQVNNVDITELDCKYEFFINNGYDCAFYFPVSFDLNQYLSAYEGLDLSDMSFTIKGIFILDDLSYVNEEDFQTFSLWISYTDYNEIESVDIDNTGTLDNAFIYSVNQLNEVPLFSWAKDSFLVTPFTYITGLFGVPSTSPINTMLSYWLDISIIWLVFDLVMYVPLLVHRWLDKGVLE